MNKLKLLEKYKRLLKETVNPDGFNWENLEKDGWNKEYLKKQQAKFKTVEEFFENDPEQEFDESQQTEIRIYNEIIDDLSKI